MRYALGIVTFVFIVIMMGNMGIVAQNVMKPPVPKKVPKVLKIHGYEITDNYGWLRDRNEKKDAAIIEYLTAENQYTEAFMGPHQGLVDTLYKEILGRIKQTDLSVPYKLGEYWYFTKTEEGKQYPTYLRSRSRDGKDAEVLLDQNEMAKGFKYFSIGAFEPSDDGNLLAFSTDTTGYRQYTLQFKDLRTGKILPDRIERATSIEFSPDGKYLFFVQEDPVSKRSDKVYRHTIGTDKNDLIYEEKDVLFGVGVGRSRDKKMFFITSGAATMNEVRYMPADNALGTWKVLSPRRENHEYFATHDEGNFYIVTNRDAENFKVMKAPVSDPSEKNWTDFIAHNPAVKVDNISFFKNHIIVSEVENGLEYLRVMDKRTRRAPVRIATPETVYTMGLGNNPEYDTTVIRYGYSSMITPQSTYEYDLSSRQSTLIKQQEIPSGYDKAQYETTRVWATARDGVKVPISLVMKKGTKLDGKAPMLLYAYGSYGASTPPGFSIARLSLVDRGMIFGIAHIRGGSELVKNGARKGVCSRRSTPSMTLSTRPSG
jgi:oligopeptidase B